MSSEKKEFYSTIETAKLLGISRIAVFKKIRSGSLKAEKIGKNYAVPKGEIKRLTRTRLTKAEKYQIDQAVRKTVREYGETLKLLGNA